MGRIRIIGGKWRSRQLLVTEAKGLRPTPSRVRETLFNWLAPTIKGAHCLDCFAGTGILGFEALSRGAKSVVMLEQSNRQVRDLETLTKTFNVSREEVQILCVDAIKWLQAPSLQEPRLQEPFDIIFLDPPFEKNLWKKCLTALSSGKLCHQHTKIYVESPKHNHEVQAWIEKTPWQIIKSQQAGQVQYQLLQMDA